MLRFLVTLGLMWVLTTCATSAPSVAPTSPSAITASTIITPPTPLVATRDANLTPPPRPTFSAPTISASERQNASSTRLYLTAFQSQNVSVIDPVSGHVLREFRVEGDQSGMAVSPDGMRLYIVDGTLEGRLQIVDTATWQVVQQLPILDRSHLLGGNPITLSGDGRWLVVAHLSYQTRQRWNRVFDTQQMIYAPDDALALRSCRDAWLPVHLLGRPHHRQLYADCNGFISALDAETLKPLWQVSAPTAIKPALALAPEGTRLYGVYPRVNDLRLQVWQTSDGRVLNEQLLGGRLSIPSATVGRGEGVYLAISPDGARLYIAWEDRLGVLASDSLQLMSELHLPTPTDGLAISVDGRELYLLPSTAGDLKTRERGMWTVDAASLQIIRHASDWPAFPEPFFFAAPAPKGK